MANWNLIKINDLLEECHRYWYVRFPNVGPFISYYEAKYKLRQLFPRNNIWIREWCACAQMKDHFENTIVGARRNESNPLSVTITTIVLLIHFI